MSRVKPQQITLKFKPIKVICCDLALLFYSTFFQILKPTVNKKLMIFISTLNYKHPLYLRCFSMPLIQNLLLRSLAGTF